MKRNEFLNYIDDRIISKEKQCELEKQAINAYLKGFKDAGIEIKNILTSEQKDEVKQELIQKEIAPVQKQEPATEKVNIRKLTVDARADLKNRIRNMYNGGANYAGIEKFFGVNAAFIVSCIPEEERRGRKHNTHNT